MSTASPGPPPGAACPCCPELDTALQICLSRAKQRSRVTSLKLLAKLFPMHTRISEPLGTHGCQEQSAVHRTPGALCSCSPAAQPPARTGAIPPQAEDPTFPLAGALTALSCPLQPVEAPLQGCTALGGLATAPALCQQLRGHQPLHPSTEG